MGAGQRIEIGLARGKKAYDKGEDIKKCETEREMKHALKTATH